MKKHPIPLSRFTVGFIALVALWGAFLVPSAFAATVLSQTISSTDSNNANFGSTFQTLGTGLSGVINAINVKYYVISGSTQVLALQLLECTGNHTGCEIAKNDLDHEVVTNGEDVTGISGDLDIEYSLIDNTTSQNTEFAFKPNMYYEFRFDINGGSGNTQIKGSNSSTYPNGSFIGTTGLADAYFLITGTNSPAGSSYAYNLKPATASTTASTYVNFTFNYNAYENDNIGEYRIKIRDSATPSPSLQVTTLTGEAGTSLGTSVSRYINLTSGHLYYWWVELCDGSGTSATCYTSQGGQQSFSVVTPFYLSSAWSPIAATSTSGSPFLGISTSTLSNTPEIQCGIYDILSGDCFSSVLSYLFIPSPIVLSQFSNLSSQLSTKIPFSYVYEIENTFNSITLNATSSMPLISIPLSTVSSSTVTGVISDLELSTTTISTYLSDSNRSLLQALMTAGIWLSVGFLFFKEAQRIFK